MFDEFYKLATPPFQLTPDPQFWFESATHRKAMAYLGYGLTQGEGFVVITGEIGAGKTTLTHHLMNMVDPNRILAIRLVSTQLDGTGIVTAVAAALGIPTQGQGKAGLLATIEHFVMDHARSGQKLLIIVDEAQGLTHEALEELRMLSNFQNGGSAVVQLLLVGHPELRDRLASDASLEQVRQRVIAAHHLTTLEPSEVRAYVEHRLKTAGWNGCPTFGDDVWRLLHAESGGVPRRLNAIMHRVLLAGAVDHCEHITVDRIGAVLDDMANDIGTAAPASAVEQPFAASAHDQAAPVADTHMLDVAARIAMLEARTEEQDAALRRILEVMVDWAESQDETAQTQHYG
jgi:general secretion pathway protein A